MSNAATVFEPPRLSHPVLASQSFKDAEVIYFFQLFSILLPLYKTNHGRPLTPDLWPWTQSDPLTCTFPSHHVCNSRFLYRNWSGERQIAHCKDVWPSKKSLRTAALCISFLLGRPTKKCSDWDKKWQWTGISPWELRLVCESHGFQGFDPFYG